MGDVPVTRPVYKPSPSVYIVGIAAWLAVCVIIALAATSC